VYGGCEGGDDGSDKENDAESNEDDEPCFHYVNVWCNFTLVCDTKHEDDEGLYKPYDIIIYGYVVLTHISPSQFSYKQTNYKYSLTSSL